MAVTKNDFREPDLSIINPHHHLWDYRAAMGKLPPGQHLFMENMRRHPLSLLDRLVADGESGSNIRATPEAGSHYRKDGPVEPPSIGETRCVVGAQKQAAARGKPSLGAAIVGRADLTDA